MTKIISFLLFILGLTFGSLALSTPYPSGEPFPPFKIAGNLYYVGNKDLASYLIVSSEGNILINSNLQTDVPAIKASIEQLGFKFADTKILLISHAHADHDAGSALIKQMTGASYMVMDEDAPVVESGGKLDFQYGNDSDSIYEPTKVDHVLHDGEEVKLGDARLIAHRTAGHTKGCTTWTMKIKDKNKSYDVVILGSPNVNPGYQLINNQTYPDIAKDYKKSFEILKSLHCDLFLGAHAGYFGLERKYAALKKGAKVNPFVDPEGYKRYITEKEERFMAELNKQQVLNRKANG
ncbi:subclass B3 metallo-beta-lactamase [Legionella jordanis]|uniref:subclass B3 metallo-beta-lactamase n=1 Tax=Legionella jordanis TaxID=456 RepID=UPI000EFDE8B3|nr:subclass B3 metallo-beta-lactamase [Legionella jordanis]RMX21020.1 subclass B3 metallo-beta-lactamase [Legionella jordanis]